MYKSLFGSSYAGRMLALGLAAVLIQSAAAHTYVSSVVVGGTALAEGDCVRPHPVAGYDDPISLVSSSNMTCGFLPQAATAANRACPITAGSQMGVQWHHNNDLPGDDILDSSHKGPILFYLAKSDTGAGNVWFKIWEDGYDATTGLWATDRMIATGGLSTFTIPSDIAPGNYLLRGEVLALHQAYEVDGVQPYVGCVELTISGSGSNNPAGVAFPGAYSDTDPGILINIYTAFPLPYPIPGPALYEGDSSEAENGGAGADSSSSSSSGAAAPPTVKPSSTSGSGNPPTYPPTSAPTAKPTNPPASSNTGSSSNTGGSLTVQLNQGSSAWWLGVVVAGGSETTSQVEIMDSGAVASWTALQQLSYAWVFSQSVQLTLPISVRLTSSSGQQVTLSNAFTSFTNMAAIAAGDYGSSGVAPGGPTEPSKISTSAPTDLPATSAPTQPSTVPTMPATSAPSGGSPISVALYPSSSMWWFAITLNGAGTNIASVEVKDSGAYTSYLLMNYAAWGYYAPSSGSPFIAPLTVRITNEAGQSVTATVTDFTAGAVFASSGSL